VSHYAPTHDLSSPWRTRTLIVSVVAAAELVALIALAVVLLGKGWFQHERAAATKAAVAEQRAAATTRPTPTRTVHKTASAKPLLTRAQTSILVLNGNGRNGAAGAESRVLRAHGYSVRAVGNAKRSDYAASIVMYRPGYSREATRLARDLKIPIVSVLDGILVSQLKGAKAVLIVGK
jgi:LytR cell envelope-related transcriptional attenuator